MVVLARVANHLLCVGAHLADLGSLHSLLWLMEERERLMRVTGHLTGSRLHPMWIVPGGVARDPDHALVRATGLTMALFQNGNVQAEWKVYIWYMPGTPEHNACVHKRNPDLWKPLTKKHEISAPTYFWLSLWSPVPRVYRPGSNMRWPRGRSCMSWPWTFTTGWP